MESPEHRVHGTGDIAVHGYPMPALDLDQNVKRGWGAPLQDGFLSAPTSGFFIRQRDGFNSADQIRQCRIDHEVFKLIAVCGRDKLNSAFGYCPCGLGFELRTDLVDYDHLGHVILDRLYHQGMLLCRCGYLHAPRPTYCGMRNVAVSSDFVRCIDDYYSLVEVISYYARDLT
jgi:hypothetical protein